MYFVEKTKGTSFVKHFDYALFAAVLMLSLIGILALRSATLSMPNGMETWFKQLACLGIGIILAMVTSTIDYKDFKTIGTVAYVGSVLLLVFTLFAGEGSDTWGSDSWLRLPVLGRFQPSELAKIAFIIVTAMFFERLKEGQDVRKNAVKLMVYAGIPIGLILLQPDAGTGMVYMFTFAVMLFIYGIKYRYFLIAFGTFVASAPFLWLFALKDYQKDRIKGLLFPGSDPLHRTLQVDKSKMTIGSGQIFGKGLYHGVQTQTSGMQVKPKSYLFESVPAKHTDFIFSVIGEELGFVGTMAVLVLVFFLLLRCLHIARNSRDEFGTFLVLGVTAVLAFHYIENIGMCIGVLPVTGIPLPFMSQGGTALISNYISVGVLLSVSMRRKRTIFNSSQ